MIEAHVESLDSLVTDRTEFTGLSGVQPWTTCDDKKMPQIISAADPEYTESARSQKVQGSYTLWITVLEDGSVSNPVIVRPLEPTLDEASIARVKQWRFRPAGAPVECHGVLATSGVARALNHTIGKVAAACVEIA